MPKLDRGLSDDAASVATSRGVSDVTGVELGSVISIDARQVPKSRVNQSASPEAEPVVTTCRHNVVAGQSRHNPKLCMRRHVACSHLWTGYRGGDIQLALDRR